MTDSHRLRLRLAYEGTNFAGWAEQPGLRTVQGELQAALARLLRRDTEPRLTVAGRTDAGVHARGQVAHLTVSAAELDRWTGRAQAAADPAERAAARARKLNGVLGREAPDVVVWAVDTVSADFDARFSALWRRYEYRLQQGVPDPLTRRFTASVTRPIDGERLRAASAQLTGLRDFTTFCRAREGATAVRHLTRFSWEEPAPGSFVASIVADAFCHSMVRSLVGAAVAAATGRITVDRVHELLEQRERSSEFTVMPAHGLSLEEIGYPSDAEFAARAAVTRARREPV